MSASTIGVTVQRPFGDTVIATRDSLAERGFGVLTEIDVAATLKSKLDVEVPPQVILGACRPQLAHRALQAAPSVATLLPCNVVVRDLGGATAVEAIDPTAMLSLAEDPTLAAVATEARERLAAALAALEGARP